jgi:hypothetical protein
MEGVLLIFVGLVVALVAFIAPESGPLTVTVYRACALVLLVMAGISLFTGARTAIMPMRLCPPIFLAAAALIFLPTML